MSTTATLATTAATITAATITAATITAEKTATLATSAEETLKSSTDKNEDLSKHPMFIFRRTYTDTDTYTYIQTPEPVKHEPTTALTILTEPVKHEPTTALTKLGTRIHGTRGVPRTTAFNCLDGKRLSPDEMLSIYAKHAKRQAEAEAAVRIDLTKVQSRIAEVKALMLANPEFDTCSAQAAKPG